MGMYNLITEPNLSQLDTEINHLLDELQTLALKVQAPQWLSSKSFNTILKSSLNKKIEFYNELKFNISYMEEMISNSKNFNDFLELNNELSFIKRSLNRRNLVLGDSSIDSLIKDSDIIEVYDSSGVQICRSWSYFKMCSYSLPELLTYSWSELYLRPKFVENKLKDIALSLFSSKSTTVTYDIPKYLINEKFSRGKNSFLFLMKFASPVLCKDTKNIIGFITTGELENMENDLHNEKTFFL